jgi:hypothetical protein
MMLPNSGKPEFGWRILRCVIAHRGIRHHHHAGATSEAIGTFKPYTKPVGS